MRTSYDTDSSSDDDDSDDNAVAVYLGYAGRMCTTKEDHGAAASLNSYQRTKIGGLADYIRTTTTTTTTNDNNNNDNDNNNDNNDYDCLECLRCERCARDLSLVIQAYAPLFVSSSTTSTELGVRVSVDCERRSRNDKRLERTLYVFACTNAECSSSTNTNNNNNNNKERARMWRAFRVQRLIDCDSVTNAANEDDDSFRIEKATKDEDDWGVMDKDDWGESTMTTTTTTTTTIKKEEESLAELTEKLDKAMLEERERKKEEISMMDKASLQQQEGEEEVPFSSNNNLSVVIVDDTNVLPEFYVCSDIEPTKKDAKKNADLRRADQLLNKYAQEEGLEVANIESSLIAMHSGSVGGKNLKEMNMMDETGTKEIAASWQGETYEKGESMTASEQYLKFQKRIARAPEQIARYCFRTRDCDIVWPDKDIPSKLSKPCKWCKGKREMELQLTPGLLKEIEDALGSRNKAGRKGGISESDAIAFDFNAVGVWTCVNSCGFMNNVDSSSSDEICIREEEIFVSSDSISIADAIFAS